MRSIASSSRASRVLAQAGRPAGARDRPRRRQPGFAVYVRNKVRPAPSWAPFRGARARCRLQREATAAREVERSMRDRAIHGIIVQLPLPRGSMRSASRSRSRSKRTLTASTGAISARCVDGHPRLAPCTPLGVMTHARSRGRPRRRAARGRDRPQQHRRQAAGAHADRARRDGDGLQFEDPRSRAPYARSADILVAAAGRPRLVTADMVKPGARRDRRRHQPHAGRQARRATSISKPVRGEGGVRSVPFRAASAA